MTQHEQELFDIIKASIWSKENYNIISVSESTRKELREQAIEGLAIGVLPEFEGMKYQQVSLFAKMISVQKEVIGILNRNHIDVVIIKGIAAGVYYPVPYLRMYGDIDILVRPGQYDQAIECLSQNNVLISGEVQKGATHFHKNGITIDLHERPLGLNRVKEGDFIYHYLLSGFDDIQQVNLNQPKCAFPMLPWKQNGLELIWHIRVHLYNGIGLRQIIDWMMFVNSCLSKEKEYQEFSNVLDNAGLLILAKTVTRMCQLYLGLDNDITWCKDAKDNLCHDLMNFILDQGNFGRKRNDDKVAKVLIKYRNPVAFLNGMQKKGLREWKTAQHYIFLQPIAWIYTGVKGFLRYFVVDGKGSMKSNLQESRRRRELFDQLYDERSGFL